MRVPRKINTALQCFRAWQWRQNIDPNVKPSDIQNAFTAYWSEPNGHDFTQHKITIASGSFASRATANEPVQGMM